METAAIPPTTPPAMAPVFDLCPPIVAGFEGEPRLLVEYDKEFEAGVEG
jgi:hypothetical protein